MFATLRKIELGLPCSDRHDVLCFMMEMGQHWARGWCWNFIRHRAEASSVELASLDLICRRDGASLGFVLWWASLDLTLELLEGEREKGRKSVIKHSIFSLCIYYTPLISHMLDSIHYSLLTYTLPCLMLFAGEMNES